MSTENQKDRLYLPSLGSHFTWSAYREHESYVILERLKLYHLVSVLEASESHLGHRVLLVGSLLCREKGSIGSKREMDSRETLSRMRFYYDSTRKQYDSRDEISLELVQINVK